MVSRIVVTSVAERLGPFGGPQHVVVDVLEVGGHGRVDPRPGHARISALTSSRMGSTTRRSSTRLLRSFERAPLHLGAAL